MSEYNDKLQKIINYYGIENQINKTIEECSELIIELVKAQNGNESLTNIAEEIADVMIMAEQIIEHYKIQVLVNSFKNMKLNRTLTKINIRKWRGK